MRYYSKSNPEKAVSKPKPKTGAITPVVESKITLKDAGSKYRKEEGVLMPKSFFVIVSGGESREKDYFKIISNKDRFERIKLEFIADPMQLNPDGLLEIAKYKQEHYKTSQEFEPDKIYIVSDVDHFMNDLIRIKPQCHALDIELIISNSCFEIWLYYGKLSTKPTDFIIPTDYLKISKRFKTYLGSKVKGGINPKTAIFDIKKAIKNSLDTYLVDENGIPVLFSTNMFLLAESILPFINEELDMLFANNEKRRLSSKE